MAARDQRNRLKVPLNIVRQLRHHVPGYGKRANRPHANGVAVGWRLRDQVEAYRQRAAGAVVDDDLLAEFLRQFGGKDAGDGVGGACRSLRNDESPASIASMSTVLMASTSFSARSFGLPWRSAIVEASRLGESRARKRASQT